MSSADEVLPYYEIVQREKISLQQGMNFRAGGEYSILLMSVRPGAPYADRFEEAGTVLIYEGHDARKGEADDPKSVDQPEFNRNGTLTQNGKFHQAAQAHRRFGALPERVQVYEKLRAGIWADNGRFALTDSWVESDGTRRVFKFKLVALAVDEESGFAPDYTLDRRRMIPTEVKIAVWNRDGGKCVVCGSRENLHFDHIIPFSRGGSSLTAENVQLMCAQHNMSKGARIE